MIHTFWVAYNELARHNRKIHPQRIREKTITVEALRAWLHWPTRQMQMCLDALVSVGAIEMRGKNQFAVTSKLR